MKKKVLALSLSLVMVLGLFAGCGNKKDGEVSASDETPDASTSDTSNDTAGAGALNIAIVTSPSGVDDGSFNQDNYIGIQDFIKDHADSKVKDIRETNIDNSVPTVESIVGDYDVIVTPGFQFSGISTVAQNNTDKKFVLVDAYPTNADGEEIEVDNIYAMKFAEEEGGFLAGVAAALETKTGKVAVVNGIAYPTNVNYQFGFESGVAYANAKFGTKAECVSLKPYAGVDVTGKDVGGNYVGTFDDPAQGKVVGEALLKEGVDIIFVAAGGSGNGVFTAVKENKNAKVIGCDVDQYDDGVNGSENIVLTSSLKVMNLGVKRSLEAASDGSFKGENVTLRADSDSIAYVSEAGRNQLSEESIKKMDEAYAELKAGKITPASNFNGHTPEDFPGLK